MAVNDQLIKAIELQNKGDLAAAGQLFHEVLSADADNPIALYSLSVIALNSGNLVEALELSARGVKAVPTFAPLHFVHGTVLQYMGNKESALRSFDAALEIQPDYPEVLLNSGAMLRGMFRHNDALERFNRLVNINPDHVGALGNCGIILTEFKQSEQAIAMFERLIKIKPDYDYALGLLFYERMHICDWTDFNALTEQIIEGVRAGRRTCKSLAFMSASDAASDHLLAAQIFARHYCPKNVKSFWQGERYRHEKIRIAYLSPDFREHPVGHLMAGVFEHHDKSRFETIAISLGIDDQSRLRGRMLKAFDRFIDVREIGSEQIAQMMRDMEVDIAVDLGGYTSDTRTDILSFRPAPVQINYLGYPGTMGTDYIDYILADRHIIPPEHQQFYSEKVVYLPDTYLPTDGSVRISERTPSRAECGLPETGVVFCSFSHDYKISPPVFDVWMRLLSQVPGSVLWLMSRGELAQRNLRKEAEARGVDSSRLVFAGRVPLVEDHLARYRQADMFLDTHPYNAHTTAADALMAGLPVVTYVGNSFPSRVAGSLLHAMGVPELITQSLEAYESLALRIAIEPSYLQSLKARIVENKSSCSLFDTKGFCRDLEAAYITMWRISQLGGTSDEIGVA
jgi:predicted O-linked N-acetylglucosamine transferase (SPINDLY family)